MTFVLLAGMFCLPLAFQEVQAGCPGGWDPSCLLSCDRDLVRCESYADNIYYYCLIFGEEAQCRQNYWYAVYLCYMEWSYCKMGCDC